MFYLRRDAVGTPGTLVDESLDVQAFTARADAPDFVDRGNKVIEMTDHGMDKLIPVLDMTRQQAVQMADAAIYSLVRERPQYAHLVPRAHEWDFRLNAIETRINNVRSVATRYWADLTKAEQSAVGTTYGHVRQPVKDLAEQLAILERSGGITSAELTEANRNISQAMSGPASWAKIEKDRKAMVVITAQRIDRLLSDFRRGVDRAVTDRTLRSVAEYMGERPGSFVRGQVWRVRRMIARVNQLLPDELQVFDAQKVGRFLDDEGRRARMFDDIIGAPDAPDTDWMIKFNAADELRHQYGTGREAVYKQMRDLRRQVVDADVDLAALDTGARTDVVVDFPRVRLTQKLRDGIEAPEAKFRDLWARNTAALIRPGPPISAQLGDVTTGAREFRAWLRHNGANNAAVVRYVDRFRIADSVTDRHKVIANAMREMASDRGPYAQSYVERFLGRMKGDYLLDQHGDELAGVPLLNQQRWDVFVFPPAPQWKAWMDRTDVATMLDRFRQGKGLSSHIAHKLLVGADRTGTNRKRREIATKLRNDEFRRLTDSYDIRGQLTGPSIEDLDAQMLDELMPLEDFAQAAYAETFSKDMFSGNSYGALWRARRMMSPIYKVPAAVFSYAMLLPRGGAWMSRVLLDEGARQEMAGLVSWFARPNEAVNSFVDAWRFSRNEHQHVMHNALANFLDAKGPRELYELTKEMGLTLKHDPRTLLPEVRDMKIRLGIAMEWNMAPDDLATMLGVRKQWDARSKLAARNLGVDPNFSFNVDATEILNRSFLAQFESGARAGLRDRVVWQARMTGEDMDDYARSWFQLLYDYGDSAAGRLLLDYASGIRTLDDTVQHMARTPDWLRNGANWQKVAVDHGLTSQPGYGAEGSLGTAATIIKDVLGPHMRTMLGPLKWDHAAKRFLTHNSGISHRSAGFANFVEEGQAYVRGTASQKDSLSFPKVLPAFIDRRFNQPKMSQAYPLKPRRLLDWTMNFFGERPSQRFMRQPAYLAKSNRSHAHYVKLGLDDATAKRLAHNDAARSVNHIYFNNTNVPVGIQSMNRVSPFFSAQVEVFSTWAWKLPVDAAGPVVGHAYMVHKLDRVLDALSQTGLFERDEEGQLWAVVDKEGNPASKALWYLSGGTINWLVGRRNDLDDAGDGTPLVGDRVAWAVGNPLDPTTYGVFSMGQLGVSPQPIAQPLLSKLYNRLPFLVTERVADASADGPEQFGEFLLRTRAVDGHRVISHNEAKLAEALGPEALVRLRQGDYSVELPEHLTLTLPETSLMGKLVDRTFFPWGRYEHYDGTMIRAYTPGAVQHLFRGLGLWSDGDTLTNHFVSQAQIDAGMVDALQWLEAHEGTIGEWHDATLLVGELMEQAGAERAEDIADPDQRRMLQAAIMQVGELEARAFARAADIAGGIALMRGITGMLTPATPRFMGDDDRARKLYYGARDIARAAKLRYGAEDGEWLPLPTAKEDAAAHAALVEAFVGDESGTAARAFVRRHYPGMFSAVRPKTYWAALGRAPTIAGIDEWFGAIERGDRKFWSPEQWVYLTQASMIYADHELAIQNRWGTDPLQQAVGTFREGYDYRQMRAQRDADLGVRDMVNDHVLQRPAQMPANEFTAAEAVLWRLDRLGDDVGEILDGYDWLNLDEAEARKLTAALRPVARAIGDQVSELRAHEGARLSERDRVRAEYFDEVTAPYWDRISDYNQQIADSLSSFERDMLLRERRLYSNDAHIQKPTLGGVVFPSEEERSWNVLDEDEKRRRALRAAVRPLGWMTLHTGERVVELFPAAEGRVPYTMEQFQIYDDADRRRIELNQMDKAGAMPASVVAELRSHLDQALYQALNGAGRGGEAVFSTLYPMQRLAALESLPEVLHSDLQQVNQVHQILLALGKGPQSRQGQQFFGEITAGIEASGDPAVFDAYRQIGFDLWDTNQMLVILSRMFYDDPIGRIR